LLLIISNAGFIIGYAKPVQVNPNNFQNPRLGFALTSIAGPLANLTIAALLTIPFHLSGSLALSEFLYTVIRLNIVLMLFNLIPIPPLDGSKVLYLVLPKGVDTRVFETYGPILLLMLIFFGGGLLSAILGPGVGTILSFLGLPG